MVPAFYILTNNYNWTAQKKLQKKFKKKLKIVKTKTYLNK